MDLTLSWDLFVIIFFGIVISYSFIIGKHESVKIIVFTYIAIVAGQAAGNILQDATLSSSPLLKSIGLSIDITVLGGTKLFIFVATIILLAIRGGFDVAYGKESNTVANSVLTGLFGFATAGLLLSTLLTFVAGVPILDPSLATTEALLPILGKSKLLEAIVVYQDLWYVFPALLLICVGIVSNSE